MQPTSELIVEAALKLPESERLTIVSRLLEAMPADDALRPFDDASWVEELDHRFADHDGSIPWTELRAED